ncbi:lysin B [Mycobacterium phage Acolyte]|nr:lysin B [Mycobacterium phage Acolyte]
MPLRQGDANPTVAQWRHVMNARFGGLYTRLHGPLPEDTDQFGLRAVEWQKEYESRTGQPVDGVVSDGDLAYLGIGIPPLQPSGQVCVGFTIGGAGSAWNNGYQWDLGEALDKRRMYHQPIGFNTNPFPMQTGVNDGVNELVRQLDLPRPQFGGRNCTQIPWFVPLSYSMGSIVWMTVLMRVLYGDLQRFKPMYMGSNSFGNPARQKNHGLPNGILVEGEGIAWTPSVHDVPDCHWDFTAEKGMIGSPGNDLYARVDGSDITVADMRAVWELVRTGNPLSLAAAALKLAASPSFSGGYAAAVAALQALDFFVVKRLTPHTTYQFIQPIEGDPRDCWRIALDHSADIVARLPVGAAGT